MKLAARLLLFVWGAGLVAGCGSPPPPKGEEPDAGKPGKESKEGGLDAGRSRDLRGVIGGSLMMDAARPAPDAPPERRRDGREGRDATADSAESDVRVGTRDCTAGHSCTGNTRCQRSCFGQLIYRCSCADGHFVCTGCMAVDGGAPDVRGGPEICAAGVAEGRRCDEAGAVCQQRGDGPQRLCACGTFNADRIWICQ